MTDLVLRMEVDVSPNQIETYGSLEYILIGDVGQTKEDELYKYNWNLDFQFVSDIIIIKYCLCSGIIANGFILSEYVTVAGSNAFRIGNVGSVRLRYQKDAFKENEIIVQRVVVQQANVTINAIE